MNYQQNLASGSQIPSFLRGRASSLQEVSRYGVLGNLAAQSVSGSFVSGGRVTNIVGAPHAMPSQISPSAKLEVLIRERFSPEGKTERVAKSLAALNQEGSIVLTPQEWRFIAEDVDVEDQF